MSYSDTRGLPIPYRKWFLNRLSEEFKKNAEARDNQTGDRFEPSPKSPKDIPMGELNLESQRRVTPRVEKKFK